MVGTWCCACGIFKENCHRPNTSSKFKSVLRSAALKKKKSQMPDTDQKDEESIEESWQESLKPVKSMPTAFPPAFFS